MPRASANSTTSIERALAILETLSHHRGLTNSDMSRKLKIPKSSASYILQILEANGYLFREADSGRYCLTDKISDLTLGALGSSELCRVAMPVLKRIVQQTNLASCLLVLDGADALYVERVNCASMRIEDWIGPRMETHATAGGKAMIAYLPRQETEIVLSHCGLRQWTTSTITSSAKLFAELDEVRKRGYAIDRGEYTRNLHCVAAPIFGPLGQVDGCIGVAGTAEQIDDAAFVRLGTLVRESARVISGQLGPSRTAPAQRNSWAEIASTASASRRAY